MSSCTVPDRTRRPAPGWRSCCGSEGSRASAPWPAATKRGSTEASRSRCLQTNKPKPGPEGPLRPLGRALRQSQRHAPPLPGRRSGQRGGPAPRLRPDRPHMWGPILPKLAARHIVVVPDLRGAGGSAKPAGGYDKKTMARDIWELTTSPAPTRSRGPSGRVSSTSSTSSATRRISRAWQPLRFACRCS